MANFKPNYLSDKKIFFFILSELIESIKLIYRLSSRLVAFLFIDMVSFGQISAINGSKLEALVSTFFRYKEFKNVVDETLYHCILKIESGKISLFLHLCRY